MANVPYGQAPIGVMVEVDRVMFGILKIAEQRIISSYNLVSMASRIEIIQNMSHEVEGMALALAAKVVGDRTETNVRFFTCPETWLDAFKLRWFPPRLLKRWPVKFRSERIVCTTIIRCCPHLELQDKKDHVDFMMYRPHKDG